MFQAARLALVCATLLVGACHGPTGAPGGGSPAGGGGAGGEDTGGGGATGGGGGGGGGGGTLYVEMFFSGTGNTNVFLRFYGCRVAYQLDRVSLP